MFTLVQDREKNQDPLFPIMLVPFPVPVPVPVPCTVTEPSVLFLYPFRSPSHSVLTCHKGLFTWSDPVTSPSTWTSCWWSAPLIFLMDTVTVRMCCIPILPVNVAFLRWRWVVWCEQTFSHYRFFPNEECCGVKLITSSVELLIDSVVFNTSKSNSFQSRQSTSIVQLIRTMVQQKWTKTMYSPKQCPSSSYILIGQLW